MLFCWFNDAFIRRIDEGDVSGEINCHLSLIVILNKAVVDREGPIRRHGVGPA